jgi:hypothetical protein
MMVLLIVLRRDRVINFSGLGGCGLKVWLLPDLFSYDLDKNPIMSNGST